MPKLSYWQKALMRYTIQIHWLTPMQYYSELSYIEVLNQGLKVMDSTATSLCMDNHIPILVFGLNEPENILRAIMGEKIGTIIQEV